MRIEGKPSARSRAKRLRRTMTLPEIALWLGLRRNAAGLRFRRQHAAGSYVLDFYCAPVRLAIEVDGENHGRGDRPARDAIRDDWLSRQGTRMVRYPAAHVLAHTDDVVRQIVAMAVERQEVFRRAPPPAPSVTPAARHLPLAGEDEIWVDPPPPGGGGSRQADGGGGERCGSWCARGLRR